MGQNTLTSAYRRLGITIRFLYAPSPRALALSSSGTVDGELVRIEGIEKRFPTLVPVKVPIARLETGVFVSRENAKRISVDTLSEGSVGHMAGVVFAESLTKGFQDVWIADTHDELFKMLNAGRVDAVISSVSAGTRQIQKMSYGGDIVALEPPLRSVPLYHYLNDRHAALVPKIEAVLADMTKVGEMSRIPD